MSLHNYIDKSHLYFVLNHCTSIFGLIGRVDLLVYNSQSSKNKQNFKSPLVSFFLRILQHPQWTVIKNSSLPSTLSQQALLSLVSYDKVCLITNCLVILYALLDAHISLTNRCIFLYLSTLERIYYLSLWDKKFRKCSRSLCTFKHKKSWMIR